MVLPFIDHAAGLVPAVVGMRCAAGIRRFSANGLFNNPRAASIVSWLVARPW
ncbi:MULTISPECIES: hypothetical protein [unclassified Amycolatopsis]|uniref:hypothetical protein n=1 Tax=unclassified Amycolatopsis TaxID=2618356 RepID=UPI001C6991BE|nr:hypothetical protein [Amycolatopsis sp. DSM 110486]QYN16517.1 hypothetical protein K1T34_26925 [Amycolatopsis sp. DSM 110486]